MPKSNSPVPANAILRAAIYPPIGIARVVGGFPEAIGLDLPRGGHAGADGGR